MKKTFKVYNENVTWVTVDIPDGADDNDTAERINEQYYNGYNPHTEEIPEPVSIEDEDGNDLSYRFGMESRYSEAQMENLLRSVVDYECEEGTENARRNLEAMGFSEEQMAYFGFPETE